LAKPVDSARLISLLDELVERRESP
jgi:hypothetical protein